ncbi:MAG: hypothetical protein ACJA08_000003 [Cyclobacteriaceae bacterium]|jgi:hypothetical protein
MNKFVSIFILQIALIFCLHTTYAQVGKKTKDLSEYMPTQNVDSRKEMNTNKNRPKRKHLDYIFKNDLNGILYGNPCAIEATRKMGFEYVFQPLGIPGSLPVDEQFSNNIMVNIKLIFTRSPFWKLILNRRIKKCKQNSGDMVGYLKD